MLAGLALVEVFDFDYNCLYRPRENELYLFNLFVSNTPFLYPLKTENLTVFWCFQGIEKGCIEKKWVKLSETIHQFKKQYFFYCHFFYIQNVETMWKVKISNSEVLSPFFHHWCKMLYINDICSTNSCNWKNENQVYSDMFFYIVTIIRSPYMTWKIPM